MARDRKELKLKLGLGPECRGGVGSGIAVTGLGNPSWIRTGAGGDDEFMLGPAGMCIQMS